MRQEFKLVSIVLCLVLMTVFPLGCGSQGVTTEVIPEEGATIELDQITLNIPPGALSERSNVTVRPEDNPPPLFPDMPKEDVEMLSKECKTVGQAYDFDLPLDKISEPVTIQLQYSDSDIPEGFSENGLFVALYDDDGWKILPTEVDTASRTVSTEVSHNSITLIILVGGGLLVLIVGLSASGALITKIANQRKAEMAEASARFDALKAQYMQNYAEWTPEKRMESRRELLILAAKANIKFDPDSLPLEPPSGGAGGTGGHY
jgi:hypothetical protein